MTGSDDGVLLTGGTGDLSAYSPITSEERRQELDTARQWENHVAAAIGVDE